MNKYIKNNVEVMFLSTKLYFPVIHFFTNMGGMFFECLALSQSQLQKKHPPSIRKLAYYAFNLLNSNTVCLDAYLVVSLCSGTALLLPLANIGKA